jgi:hypothetical protein
MIPRVRPHTPSLPDPVRTDSPPLDFDPAELSRSIQPPFSRAFLHRPITYATHVLEAYILKPHALAAFRGKVISSGKNSFFFARNFVRSREQCIAPPRRGLIGSISIVSPDISRIQEKFVSFHAQTRQRRRVKWLVGCLNVWSAMKHDHLSVHQWAVCDRFSLFALGLGSFDTCHFSRFLGHCLGLASAPWLKTWSLIPLFFSTFFHLS